MYKRVPSFVGTEGERNPVYFAGAEMRLYKERRVDAAKKSAAWREYQKECSRRSERSRRGHEKRRKETIKWVETADICRIDDANAIRSHKKKHKQLVNYLRHKCTNYDAMRKGLHGRIGQKEAYEIIRKRCLGMIAERYPELATECEQQAVQ